jgi:hypothetical protein
MFLEYIYILDVRGHQDIIWCCLCACRAGPCSGYGVASRDDFAAKVVPLVPVPGGQPSTYCATFRGAISGVVMQQSPRNDKDCDAERSALMDTRDRPQRRGPHCNRATPPLVVGQTKTPV